MSGRVLVVEVLTQKLREAFIKGDLVDAQNLEAFITSLEAMDDRAYADRVAEAEGSDCLAA